MYRGVVDNRCIAGSRQLFVEERGVVEERAPLVRRPWALIFVLLDQRMPHCVVSGPGEIDVMRPDWVYLGTPGERIRRTVMIIAIFAAAVGRDLLVYNAWSNDILMYIYIMYVCIFIILNVK